MAHRVDLFWFSFTVVWKAILLPETPARDAIAGLPEIRCPASIRNARDHVTFFAAFDLPKGVPAKLEIVALLIDRPASGALDQYAVVDSADQDFLG